ncbi:MAG: DUF3857 domain-containing protein [Lutibacter sp.]|nr:MAG: DUF3857 domain-containing protein [Lutibacter sp.]
MKKNALSTLLVLFFIVITYSQDYNFNVSSIPENLKENANSVIRFENISIEMASQREMTIKIKKAITIYNKLADKFADVMLHYDKRRNIKNIVIYFYDANGKEIKKVKKKEYKDFSASDGFSLYNDGRLLYYDYTPITYPYTIYYKYEIKTSNTAFIQRWVPIKSYSQSIEKSNFRVQYPPNFTLYKSEKNFKTLNIKTIESVGSLSYEVGALPAVKYEPFAPFFLDIFPNVKLGVNKFNLEGIDGEANNWNEFGKWYYDNLIKNTLNLKEDSKQKIRALTQYETDPIEKAKIVYDFVQNKVRYISIQVGIGGFKPMPANDVDNLGYGDCKALTNYTASLLKEVGIESYHTLIYADEKRDLDANVASPEGNHMILYVPISGKDIWLECTSQKNPFGEIGDFTDDRDALVITPNGGIIKHTKKYKTAENLQLTTGMFDVDNNGTITAKLNIESSGIQYGDNLMESDGKSPKELDLRFKEYLSNINNIKFRKIAVKNNRNENKYEENLEFTASNYTTFSGDQMFICVNAFNKSKYVPKRVRNRKLAFRVSSSFIDIDEIYIKLPSNFNIEYLPENVELKSKFGVYKIEINKIDDSTYLYKRKLQIEEKKYPKEAYETYRKFRKNIRKYDNSKIILTKK